MKNYKFLFITSILSIVSLYSCNGGGGDTPTASLTSISATIDSNIFNVGETIEQDEVILTATYSDETTKVIESKDYTIDGFVDNKYTFVESDVPEKTFTCNYLDKTCQFTVSVDTLVSISASISKTTYSVNDTINQDDVTLKGTYIDGSIKKIESKYYTIIGFTDGKYTFTKDDTGEKTFLCQRGRKNCQFSVTVKDIKYIVTFDTNGGTPEIPSQTITSSNPKAIRPTDPTKTNNRFFGWYTDKSLTTKYDFDQLVTQNLTLYAGWGHFVSFSNEGIEGEITQQQVLDNHYAYHPGLPTSTIEGKNCYGWSLKDDEYFMFSTTPITSDITLKPLFAKAKIFEIKGDRIIDSSTEAVYYKAQVEDISASDLKWEVLNGNDLLNNDGDGHFSLTEKGKKCGGLVTIKASYVEPNGNEFFGMLDVSIGTFNCLDTNQLKNGIITLDESKKSLIPINFATPKFYIYQESNDSSWQSVQLTSIADNAFRENSATIASVYIPNTLNSVGGNAFYDKNSGRERLNELIFDYEDGSPLVIKKAAFAFNCFLTLKFPERLTQLSEIAFAVDGRLTNLDMGEASLEYIGFFTFYGCIFLSKIQLPKVLKKIDNAFLFNRYLNELTIPATCTEICSGFIYFKNLNHINFEAEHTWNIIQKSEVVDTFTGKEITAKDSKYLSYFNDPNTNWKVA